MLLWRVFWAFRIDFSEQLLGTDVAIMSVFYQKSNLEAGGDSLEAVKNNLSALKQLLEVKMQLIPIESVVRIEVILVNRE